MLANILDELTKLDTHDLATKRELLSKLSNTPQADWPTLIRQHNLRTVYNKQLAAREQTLANAQPIANEQQAITTTTTLTATPPTPTVVTPTLALTPKLTELVLAKSTTPSLAMIPAAAQQPLNPFRQTPTRVAPLDRLPARSATSVPPVPPVLQVLSAPPQAASPQVIQQVSYNANSPLNSTQLTRTDLKKEWQVHLQNAVQGLQAIVQPEPGSPDEVNQHMRLRVLQLLAGNEEAALQAIPGATANQQDFWNSHLFTTSTILDSKRQPDNKRRAAGALLHLDHARAKLAEQATLQVRKLSLVHSVNGYGAYDLHTENKFKPGASITLYAEIENFSSESTPEGYRTRLATSYEVLNKNGKRVDSAELPEVEDLCQNPRRDFHMHYTVRLPTRIYADAYTIRLTITDLQSQKIGLATVPFEIIE